MEIYGKELILPPSVLSIAEEKQIRIAAINFAARFIGEQLGQELFPAIRKQVREGELLTAVLEIVQLECKKEMDKLIQGAVRDGIVDAFQREY